MSRGQGAPSRWAITTAALVAVIVAGGARAEETSGSAASDESEPAAVEPRADVKFQEYVEVDASELPSSNTISTKLPTPAMLTPANIGSVTGPVLWEQRSTVLGDALHNVSSVNVQAGPAVFDFFTIRGFDSISSSLILTDGAGEPESTFLPVYNIEAVEVLKGPSGFLYGPNPLAGAVNLVRKQPLAADFAIVGAQGGSFDTYQGTLDWNIANDEGNLAFRLNGLWNDTEGYRDATDGRIAGANPSFTWRASEATTLTFNAEYLDLELSPDSGIPLAPLGANGALELPDVPRRRSYQTPFDYSDQQVTRFQLDAEHRVNDALRLRNKLYYRGLDWQTDGTLFNGAVDVGGGEFAVQRTFTRLDDRQQFIGNQLEAVIQGAYGAVEHEMLAGLEVGRYGDEFSIHVLPPFAGMPSINLFEPSESLTQSPPTASMFPLEAGDASTLLVAPYVVDRLELTSEFEVTIGLRWDMADFDDDLRGISRDDTELSPKLGVLWAPNPKLSLYGNASSSWALPSARLAQNALNTFDPEESRQLELGLKKRLAGERVRLTAAVYEMERENLPLTLADGFTQQEADQRSRGFEAEVAAEIAPRLHGLLSYAYTDAELTSYARCDFPGPGGVCLIPLTVLTGNDPAYAPEHLANLWLSKSLESGWGFGGGARYVGGQYFNEDNLYEVDDYVTLGAMVYRDWSALRARVNFENLTDEEYETGSFSSTSIVPARPFAVYGTVEYRF